MSSRRSTGAAAALPLAGLAPGLDTLLASHFAALPAQWAALVAAATDPAAVAAIAAFVDARRAAGARIFPPRPLAALQDCLPAAVRVVILGQDPYHGPGQAHGYAFSVPEGIRIPPSLRNIFLEQARDLADGRSPPGNGNLQRWSRQGVLLLNTVLTVEEGAPGSHAGHGWEAVTDALIAGLVQTVVPKVFLLWGAHAQAKGERIAAAATLLPQPIQPLVLTANHPSPLSARRPPLPFIGCGHFSRTNAYLAGRGLAPIDW
jgi:uracil-DNA glycosylase